MSHTNRICWVAASCVLWAALSAAAGPGQLEQRKCQVVQAALEKHGQALIDPALLKAISGAEALLDIELGVSEEATRVSLRATGRPLCKAFTLDEGRKVVVDLYDTINFRSGTIRGPEGQSLVRQVRTSLFAAEPQFVSRVVIDLAAPCICQVSGDEGQTVIDVALVEQLPRSLFALSGAITSVAAGPADRKVRIEVASARLDDSEECRVAPAVAETQAPEDVDHGGLAVQRTFADGFNALDLMLTDFSDETPLDVPDQALCRLAVEIERVAETVGAQEADAVVAGTPAPSSAAVTPMLLTFADLRAAVAGAQQAAVSVAARSALEMRRAQSRVARVLEGWQHAVTRAETAARDAQQTPPLPVEVSPDAAAAGEGRCLLLAESGGGLRPPVIEQRIIELATELDAVRNAEPDLHSDVLAPLAALADQVGREVSAASPEGPQPGPPAKRALAPREDADVAWHTIERPPLDAEGLVVAQATDAVVVAEAEEMPKTYVPQADAAPPVEAEPARPARAAVAGDPLEQIVDIDFRDMELSHVVGLLADKAHINVVAGVEVKGKVTARLSSVPLRQAMETVLRLNGLGMIQEGAVYRIVPYQEVLSAMQVRRIVSLDNAKADDIKATLQEVVVGMPEAEQVTLSANISTNVLILTGPEDRVMELEDIIRQLDVAEPVLPTVTEAIKLNYATPSDLLKTLSKGMVSEDVGQVAADDRGRFLIVTDIPIKVEQIRELVNQLDMPVKQVSIDAMVVDAVLTDDAETGVDWFVNAVRRVNTRGNIVGNLQELMLDTGLSTTSAGQLTFDILSSDINLKGVIASQIKDNKGRLLANPSVVTVENKPATINITTEVPYDEKQQSLTGPAMTSTGFKDIGTILEVTPRVTHDDHILVDVMAKQSSAGELAENGIPTEIKREAETSLRTKNNQTIFIGGLRSYDSHNDVTKLPVLGDVPVVNFLFRHTSIRKQTTELLIFLTCNVLPDEPPELTPEQQAEYDRLGQLPEVTNSQKEVFHTVTHPNEYRPPVWRRTR